MPSPKNPNPLPDCLFMKLHCEPVQIAVREPFLSVPLLKNIYKNESILSSKYSLKLTLRFGEQTQSVNGGLVTFGLKEGQLRLKLTNAKLLLETVRLTPKFSTDTLVEESQETATEKGGILEGKVIPGITGSYKETTKSSKKYQAITSQVYYAYGSEDKPTWNFQVNSAISLDKTGEKIILQGFLQEELMGILEVTGESPKIEALFYTDINEDILVTRIKHSTQDFKLDFPEFYLEDRLREWIKQQTPATNVISEVEVIL